MAQLTTAQIEQLALALRTVRDFLNGTSQLVDTLEEAFARMEALLRDAGFDDAFVTSFRDVLQQQLVASPLILMNTDLGIFAQTLADTAVPPGAANTDQNGTPLVQPGVALSTTPTTQSLAISEPSAGSMAPLSDRSPTPLNAIIRPELTGLTIDERSVTGQPMNPELTRLTGDAFGSGVLPPGVSPEIAVLTLDGTGRGFIDGVVQGIGGEVGSSLFGGIDTLPPSSPTSFDVAGPSQPSTPAYSITAIQPSVMEGDDGLQTVLLFTVSRDLAGSAGQVSWQLSGLDPALFGGTLPSGTLNFVSGQTSQTISITVSGNLLIDGDRVATVTLSNPGTDLISGSGAARTSILDDDGTVSIAASRAAVPEGDLGQTTEVEFVVTRSNSRAVATVDWSASGLDPADLVGGVLPSGSLSFTVGETSKIIRIPVRGDQVVEPDETLTVTLSNPSGNLTVDTGTASSTVLNDDGVISIVARQSQVLEGDTGSSTPITFTVSRTTDNGPSSVNWSVAGTGITADDLMEGLASDTLEFADGELTKDIVLRVRGDRTVEESETLSVNLSNPQGNVRLGTSSANTTILNDDTGISIAGVTTDVVEGGAGQTTAVTFRITRAENLGSEADIDWRFVRVGTNAADASDFVTGQNTLNIPDGMPSGRVTFAINQSEILVTVNVQGENLIEPNETFGIVLFNPPAGVQIINGEAYGTIRTDESVFSIAAVTPTTAEGSNGTGGIQEFVVTRTGNISQAASINFQIDGTGELPAESSDFAVSQGLTGTVSFAAGESTKTIQVSLSGDNTLEGTEAFSVTLVPTSVNTPVDVGSAVASITNDDSTVSITARNGVVREGSVVGQEVALEYVLTRTGDLSAAASVNWQVQARSPNPVDAADFGGALPSGVVTFAPGQSEATIRFSPRADNLVESRELLQVSISTSTPGLVVLQSTANGEIINDDSGFTLNDTALRGPEGDPGAVRTLSFTVSRNGDLTQAVGVDWAVLWRSGAGAATSADFNPGTAFSGRLEFDRGESSKVINFPMVPNSVSEGDRGFDVQLSNPSVGAQTLVGSGVGAIQNDDVVFNLVAAANQTEGSGGTREIRYTVQRTGDTTGTDTIGWSVVGGAVNPVLADDLVGGFPSNTLVFNPGDTTQDIVFQIATDSVLEPDETFTVQLGTPNPGATVANGTATGTVLNDDHVYALSSITPSVSEGADGQTSTLSFTIARTGALGAGQVGWRVVGDGANQVTGGDFQGGTLPTGTAVFASNAATQTVTLTVSGDFSLEENEGLRVELFDPAVGSTVNPASASATAQILNDDTALAIATTTSNLPEGASGTVTHSFTVTRTGVTTGTTTVDWAVSGDVNVADFGGTLPSGTLTFGPGVTTQVIELSASGDNLIELNEAFAVTLSNASGNAQITTAVANGSIVADDIGISIAAGQTSVLEGTNGATQVLSFTVTRTGDLASPVALDWAATGLQADDFALGTTLSGRLVFDANQTTKTLEFTLRGDNSVESAETLTVALTNPVDNPAGSRTTITAASATTVVVNDDTSLSIAADTPASRAEGAALAETSYTFTVTRSGELPAASINWVVQVPGGTGSAALADFVTGQEDELIPNSGLPSGTLSFAAGTSTGTITVRVAGDGAIELDESFNVVLVNAPANTTLAAASASATIANDDLGFSIAALDASKSEGQTGATPFTFTVIRAGAVTSAALVDWSIALAGSLTAGDFSEVTGTLSFGANEASKTLTIAVNGDLSVEGDEPFTVTLTNARLDGGAPQTIVTASAGGSILNDDQSFSVAATDLTVVEGSSGTKTLVWTITRSGDTSTAASVAYAVTGSNGANDDDVLGILPSGTLSFAAGQGSQTVNVDLTGDTVVEGAEVFTFTLSSPSANTTIGTGTASTTVTNDDTSFSLAAPASQAEGSTGERQFQFTVTRSGLSDAASTVQWRVSAASGLTAADFASGQDVLGNIGGLPSGTVSFVANGSNTQTITVRALGDLTLESTEDLQVVLSNPSLGIIETGQGTASTQILNDDTQFNISVPGGAMAEGNSGTQNVTFTVTRLGSTTGSAVLNWTVGGDVNAADLSTPTSGTVSFADRESTASIVVGVQGDSIVEKPTSAGIEALTVTLSGAPAGTTIGTASATKDITNDDAALAISLLSAVKPESNSGFTEYTFQVTRSEFTPSAVSVDWRVDTSVLNSVTAADFSGSQVAGVQLDVNGIPFGTINFAANDSTPKTITLRIAGDNLLEPNEVLRVLLQNPSAGAEIVTASADGTVQNDDAEFTMSGPTTVTEGDGGLVGTLLTYTVTRTGNLSQTNTVNWAVTHVATNNNDFTDGTNFLRPTGSLTFNNTESSKTFQVRVFGDTSENSIEPDETFSVALSSPSSGSSLGTTSSVGTTIQNDDTRITAAWVQARQAEAVDASSTTYSITLTRSGDTAKTSTVGWQVSGLGLYDFANGRNEGAANATDFASGTSPSGSVEFTSGETSKTITFNVRGDNDVEEDEWFQVVLTNNGGIDELFTASTSTNGSVSTTVTGLDQQNPNTLVLVGEIQRDEAIFALGGVTTATTRFEGDATPDTAGGNAVVTDGFIEHTFRVVRSISTAGPASVDWAIQTTISGYGTVDASDFWNNTIPLGTLNFADGQSEGFVTIRTSVDNAGELDEAFRLYLLNPSPGSSIANGSGNSFNNNFVILDNDDTRFDASAGTVAEGQDLVYTITRDGDQRGTDSVAWSIALPGAESTNESNNASGTWYRLDPTDLDIAWIEANNPGSGITWNAGTRTLSGAFTFIDGEASKTVTLRTVDDAVRETWREEATMVLSNPVNVNESEPNHDAETPSVGTSGLGTVRDNEPAAVLSVSRSVAEIFEGTSNTTSMTFTVHRTVQVGGSIDYASTARWTLSGSDLINQIVNSGSTALGSNVGSNYSWQSASTLHGFVTFASGATTADVVVTFTADSTIESDRTVSFGLSTPEIARTALYAPTDSYGPTDLSTTPGDTTTSVNFRSDDIRLWVGNFGNVNPTVDAYEGNPLNFTVVRSGRLDTAITLNYTLINSGTANADFSQMSGTITLAAGSSSYPISIANLLQLDGVLESAENFTLRLTAPAEVTGSTVRFGISSVDASTATTLDVAGVLRDADTRYTLTPTAVTLDEANQGANSIYTITLGREGYSGAATVRWRVEAVGTNPSDASDFGGSFPTGSVSFAANDLSETFNITVRGDNQVELNETFRVVLFEETLSAPNVTRAINQSSPNPFVDLTITNNDIGISIADVSTTETDTNQTMTFTVTRSGRTAGVTSTMNWALVTSGNADTNDFTGTTNGTLTFAAGDTSETISITLVGDQLAETTETFSIVLSNISANINDLIRTTATGTILNDDSAFSIEPLSPASGQHAESNAQTFRISRTVSTEQNQTISWTVVSGTAVAADFGGSLPSGAVIFAPGELFKDITITPTNDSVAEPDETYSVQISLGTGAAGDTLTQATAQGTILNDDAAYSISSNQTQLNEGNSGFATYTFTVRRTGDLSSPGSVQWQVIGSGVTAADFVGNVLPSGTLNFVANDEVETITVQVAGDNALESDESFTVELFGPSPSTPLLVSTASSTIVNDDTSIAVVAASAVRNEGNSGTTAFTFTINRTEPLAGNRTVDWAVTGSGPNQAAGADFVGGNFPSGTVTLPGGQASVTVTVNVQGDLLAEPDEGFTVTLSNPSAGTTITTATAQGTIQTDDVVFAVAAPTPSASIAEGADGATTFFDFVVTRSGLLTGSQTLNWSVVGIGANAASANDFVATSGTVDFAANDVTETIRVEVRGDYSGEENESFRLSLTGPGGVGFTNSTADAIIVNDDVRVAIVATNASHVEGSTGVETVYTFTVSRLGNLAIGTTVNWGIDPSSAANADDFLGGLPSGTLTFAADSAVSQTISITVRGDLAVEPDETFVVRLSNPSAGSDIVTPTATGTIISDDVSWTLAALNVPTEGDSELSATPFTFTLSRTGSLLATSMAWALTPSGAHPATVDDFANDVFPSGSVDFAQGQSSQVITVFIKGNSVLEQTEGVTLTLTPPTGSLLHHTFVNQTLDAVIVNDDDVLSIAPLAAAAIEGSGTNGELTFTVTRTGSLAGTSTVGWRIVHGTTEAADFAVTTGTLTFANNQGSQVLTIQPVGDRAVELDEGFTIELFNSGAGSTIDPAATTATGTVRNDDVDLVLAAVVNSATEGDQATVGRLHYTVTRSGDLSVETRVTWAVVSGTATAADFAGGVLPGAELVFAAGETVKDVFIDLAGDALSEDSEVFTVLLSGQSTHADLATNNLTGTVVDDDDILTLSGGLVSQAENDVGTISYVFTITRSGTQTGAATVQWQAQGSGTRPLSDAEFVARSGVVSFADGEGSKTFDVQVRADQIGEYDETLEVWLSNPSFGSTINTSTNGGRVEATVVNDDPVLFITANQPSGLTESQPGAEREFTFTVTRSGRLTGSSSALWEVIPSGTNAANAEDFGGFYLSGAVAFGVNESTKTITVFVTGDNMGERNETFSVRLFDPSGASILEPEAETIIVNDDSGLTLTAVGSTSQLEGNTGETVYTYRVGRLGDLGTEVSVQWRVEGSGTFPANTGDFVGGVFPTGTLTLGTTETFRDITVRVQGDDTLGPNQTFDVVLFNPVGIETIVDRLEGTIVNDDNQFSIVTVDTIKDEGDSGSTVFRFTVSRTGKTDQASDITWAVTGSSAQPADALDFVGLQFPTGTLNFAAGETSRTLDVLVQGDALGESDEQFTVTLSSPTGTGVTVNPLQATARSTIRADDVVLTALALDVNRAEGQDGQSTLFTYRILRAGPDSLAVTIAYTISGAVNAADFDVPLSGSIQMAAGQSDFLFSLPVRGDNLREGDEPFTLTLTNSAFSGGQTLINSVIRDDDLGLQLSGPLTLTEGAQGTTQVYTYALTRNPSASSETLFWRVVSGAGQPVDATDFAGNVLPNGTAIFAADGSTATFSFTVQGDNWVEANESLRIEIRLTDGATFPILSQVVTLSNDDVAGAGDDVVVGTAGDDVLNGLDANDTLRGSSGDDVLNGGSGDDTLVGGAEADILSGGVGADRFHFNSPTEGMDSILDFEAAFDRVTVDPTAFGLPSGTLTAVSQDWAVDVTTTLSQLAALTDAQVYRVSFASGQFAFGTGGAGQLDELEAAITGGNHTGSALFLVSNGDVTRLYFDADTAAGNDGSGLVALAELANQAQAHTLPVDTVQAQVL